MIGVHRRLQLINLILNFTIGHGSDSFDNESQPWHNLTTKTSFLIFHS